MVEQVSKTSYQQNDKEAAVFKHKSDAWFKWKSLTPISLLFLMHKEANFNIFAVKCQRLLLFVSFQVIGGNS